MYRPCITPTCPNLTSRRARCTECQRQSWRQQGQRRGPRGHYGAGWDQAARTARTIWLQHVGPICAGWRQQPPHTADPQTLTVDHLTPQTLAHGVAILCRRCNAAKRDRQVDNIEAWTTIATIDINGTQIPLRAPPWRSTTPGGGVTTEKI